MNNNMHFKEEIRRSFIAYSLIPSIAFASVVIVTSVLVWNVNLYRTLARENKKTSSVLSAAVASYGNFIEEKKLAPEKIIFDDASSLSGAYTVLRNLSIRKKSPRILRCFLRRMPSYLREAPMTTLSFPNGKINLRGVRSAGCAKSPIKR